MRRRGVDKMVFSCEKAIINFCECTLRNITPDLLQQWKVLSFDFGPKIFSIEKRKKR